MMKIRLMQAYKMVPWRKQIQWIGLGALAIVTMSLVAWLYLSISSKTSIAGRDMQDFQSARTKSEQAIAAMETNLAEITSSTKMSERAKSLGFKEVNPENFDYMVVPGYGGKPSAQLAPENTAPKAQSESISSDFTQSLWDWVYSSYVEPAITK
jgi:cell division protein FtsL